MIRALCYLLLSAVAVRAEEIIVEKRPFTVAHVFEAGVVPTAGFTDIAVEPETWREFRIAEIAEHGRRVRKGETLVRFDTAGIDRQPAAARGGEQAALERDRRIFEIKAAGDGWFYHGMMRAGRWVPRDLRKNSLVPLHEPFAMVVGDGAKLALSGSADAAAARAMRPELAGEALFAGREDLRVPVIVESLADIPGPDGRHRVELGAAWPDGFKPPVGATAAIHLVVHHQAQAIVIPTRALRYGPQGWCVQLKLAEGGTQARPVRRGRAAGEESEILSGLEQGQVIVAP